MSGSSLLLTNGGRSRYREFQVTTSCSFGKQDELNASYVRSRAFGDLNDFNSYYANFKNLIIRRNEQSLLPFDAPNRFVFWGNFSVKYGLTVAPILDIRNGFPLSVIDEDRNFVGPRNRAGRFPNFASLDLQVLKNVSVPGRFSENYRVRVGVKVFNVTNHFDARDFQGNLGSDVEELRFIGGAEGGRTPDLRIANAALCQTELLPHAGCHIRKRS